MNTQYIVFKKQRELGEIITDTFKFLRRNYKPIFKILVKTAGIPFLIFIAASVYNTQTSLGQNFFDFNNPFGAFSATNIIVSTLFVYISIVIYMSFLYAGMMAIIKSYIKNQGTIIEQEAIEDVKTNISRIITTGLGKFAILFLGFMLCFFPGVYLAAPLFVVFPIMMFENKNAGDSISDTFTLIKNEWWITFATIFVMGLIWYLFSILLSLPSMIYVWVKMFTGMQEGSLSDPSSFFDLGTVILTVLASALQYLVYVFMPISAALIYFNLHEKKHQTGTLEQIDRIGE